MGETWKAIPGYEGRYKVSSEGRIFSQARADSQGRRRTGKLLTPRRTTRDHLSVALYLDGERRDVQVHRLVLEAFVGPCPDGMEGCHRDDDPSNNRLDNLRWDTRSANQLDSVRNGTHHMARRTHCPQGHEYTPENTYVYPGRRRACHECRRLYRDAHREERRAKGREYMRRKRALQRAETTTIRKAS